MATYVMLDIHVKDRERFLEYAHDVRPLLERWGARYLIRNGDVEVVEGEWDHGILVLLEFPDRATVDAFYASEEYAPLLKLRLESTGGTLTVLEGYDHVPMSGSATE